jgi:ABC-type multidrug transport system fused ATPase/permease subunit
MAERMRMISVVGIQIFLSLLDLLGVALVGVLGALAITGVGSRKPGNRVSSVLELIGIQDRPLQQQAFVLGLLAATVLVVKTLLSVILLRKVTFFLSRRGAVVTSRLLSRLLAQPLTKLQSRSMQHTLYLVNQGVTSITMGVLNTTVQVISDGSLLIILIAGLFVVDPVIALSTLGIFVSAAWILYMLLVVKSKNLGVSEAKLNIENAEKTLEVLNSYREIIVRNRRSYYAREIGRIRLLSANNAAERTFMPNISKYLIELTLVIGTLGISATQFILNDAAHAVAVLSVFMAASTRIAPAVLRMQQGALFIKTQLGIAEPALDLIEELAEVSEIENVDDEIHFDHVGFTPSVNLKDVTFSFPDKEIQAVDGVSLTISPGDVIAIVGPSGAGKTTLVDLMLGVLEPSSGKVSISGQSPLNAIAMWPGAIGYVPQDVMITNGTIISNIGMGFPQDSIPEERVIEAIRLAQLEDFLANLDQGIYAPVGDRGTSISGGQRQRIGIARAMFTRPKLLILDEATSSLDGETEASITSAIQSLKGNVTVVLIAHRLSTVREADLVVYMEAGKLIASGSFEEVRKKVPDFDRQAQLMGLS